MQCVDNTFNQISTNAGYFDEKLKQRIIKKARQNERYRLPLHANYYRGWGDIRPYLPLFAGIGVEKLYQFYTHVLYILDFHSLSNGTYKGDNEYKQIWKDMLTMVKDPVFVRKLRKLEKFTELDFRKIHNRDGGSTIPIIEYGQREFGFDRKQVLYFLVDIAVNSIQHCPTGYDKYDRAHVITKNSDPLITILQFQIHRKDYPKEDRLHALKTVYTHKVKIPNTNSFLYELNFEKLREHRPIAFGNIHFKDVVLDNLKPLITIDEDVQTE